jgi:hypothetical protein
LSIGPANQTLSLPRLGVAAIGVDVDVDSVGAVEPVVVASVVAPPPPQVVEAVAVAVVVVVVVVTTSLAADTA